MIIRILTSYTRVIFSTIIIFRSAGTNNIVTNLTGVIMVFEAEHKRYGSSGAYKAHQEARTEGAHTLMPEPSTCFFVAKHVNTFVACQTWSLVRIRSPLSACRGL